MGIREQIRQALEADAASVCNLHAQHLNPTFIEALGLFGFRRHYVRAEGLSLWDDAGHEVLDFLAGYGAISLGHNHPDVRAAVEEVLQARPPQFLLVAAQPLAAELARRLAELAPGGLDLCFFASSGSEAVEGAMKLARLATHRARFVSALRSYHGTTLGALSVTGSERHRRPFGPLLSDVAFVPFGARVVWISEHESGRAVGHLAGVADGDGSIFAIEDGFELGECFQSLIGSWADVFADGLESIAAGNVDGNDFLFETTSRHGSGRFVMRAQSKFILFLA